MIYEDITLERFLEIRGEEQWEEGRQKGLEEGRKGGIEEGVERVNKLIELLSAADRMEDLKKAATDSAFQERLFEEFGI